MGVLQQFWLYEIIGIILLMCQIPQCGYMEHGLKYITFYVQKHNIKHLYDGVVHVIQR